METAGNKHVSQSRAVINNNNTNNNIIINERSPFLQPSNRPAQWGGGVSHFCLHSKLESPDLAASGQSDYTILNVSMAEGKGAKTYHFHPEWEEDYFFVYSHSKPVCLICNTTVALAKKGSLKRHFKMVHGSCERKFPAKTLLRATKVRDLKAQLAARQSIFTKLKTHGKAPTIASYHVNHVLAKH